MTIKVVKGYLSQTEKRWIAAMITNNQLRLNTGRKLIVLSSVKGEAEVTITQRDRGLGFIGNPIQVSVYRHSIVITNN